MKNWIEDENPFNLERPPEWWLKRLWDFDATLVLVPSRQKAVYRLAQRIPPNPAIAAVNEALWMHSDIRMLAGYGLIPVAPLFTPVNWDHPRIFQELAERCPAMLGGFEKTMKRIEDREEDERKAVQRQQDEHLEALGDDGWNFIRKKAGLGRSWHQPDAANMIPQYS